VHRQGRGFKVIRRRWIIERTFSWLRHNRRLMACYDALYDALRWSLSASPSSQ